MRISEIVDQLASEQMPLTVALNKTLVICRRNGLDQAAAWIAKELRGYGQEESVPDFRLVRGTPQAFNPYRGWQAILHQSDGPLPVQMTTGAIGQPVSQIEEMFAKNPTGELEYHWGPETEAKIQASLVDFKTNVRMVFGSSQLGTICTHLKNELIDFLLKIEKDIDEDSDVASDEATSAAMKSAESSLIVNNYGSIGNFANASSDFRNSIGSYQAVDFSSFIQEYQSHRHLIAPDTAVEIDQVIEKITDSEAPKEKNALLGSLRNVLEGAGGGLVAQGLLKLLESVSF